MSEKALQAVKDAWRKATEEEYAEAENKLLLKFRKFVSELDSFDKAIMIDSFCQVDTKEYPFVERMQDCFRISR